MREEESRIVSTRLQVFGVRDDDDVRNALQALFNVFAAQGLGQATFVVSDGDIAELWLKHKSQVVPDTEVLDRVLRSAGDFYLVTD